MPAVLFASSFRPRRDSSALARMREEVAESPCGSRGAVAAALSPQLWALGALVRALAVLFLTLRCCCCSAPCGLAVRCFAVIEARLANP